MARVTEPLPRYVAQDISRLVDVCRQSIVFDTAADIAACISAIGGDVDVVVERVKNRMDPEAEFRAVGGYRDVALNLRIDTEETRATGVETHVCEVQLLLRCFDTIKVRGCWFSL